MSALSRSPLKVFVCPVCGEQSRPADPRWRRGTTVAHYHDELGDYVKAEEVEVIPVESLREKLRVAGYEEVEALLLARSSDENGDEWIPAGADVERLTADIVAVFTGAVSKEES